MGCGSSVNTQDPIVKSAITTNSKSKEQPVTPREQHEKGLNMSAVLSQPDQQRNSIDTQITSVAPRRTSVQNDELDKIIGNNVPKLLLEKQQSNNDLTLHTIQDQPLPKKPLFKQMSISMAIKEDYIEENKTSIHPIQLPSQGYLSSMKDFGQDPVQRNQKKGVKKLRGNELEYEAIFENVKQVQKQLTIKDREIIQKCFQSHYVFYNLSQSSLDGLMAEMFYCTLQKDEYVFKQGDQASSYFIIDKGEVEVIINEKLIRKQVSGESFGELALLYGALRSASIKATSECSFWALDRTTFKTVLENLISQEQQENRKFIEQVSFFSFMTSQQKDSIAGTLITTKFNPGSFIVHEGDRADSYYVIKSGSVIVLKGDKQIRMMGPKDSFGEQALYLSSTRGASCKAETEVKCVSLGRDNLTKILGDKVQIIIFNNIMRWRLFMWDYYFSVSIQIEKISQSAKINNFKADQIIFSKGDICDRLIIVLEGNIINQVTKLPLYVKGQCFGDQYLQSANSKKPIDLTLTVGSDSVLAIMNFSKIFQLIGGDLETVLKKNEQSHEKKIKQLGNRQDMSHIQVEDLIFIKKLGQGQFGSVYLVKHKTEKTKVFALKSVQKASIIEQSLEKHILQEKTVLEMINFPFIMGFMRTFKDKISIYFLVEYIKGMELFDVIREIGLLTKADTQFYLASIILALEYLHSKSIVYRDIKPENIMIDYRGYLYLIDLGTAKPLVKQKNYRTFTIIGTPHYMAPEIIAAKGYTFSADLWSIGVCAYEFMYGGVPYAEDADDPYEIYEEIMHSELKFPIFSKDRSSQKFIEQLLSKQPERRLGASYASLKANVWFDDYDWDKLFNKELVPPYIPPADQLISDEQLDITFKVGKPVVQEIKQEQSTMKQSKEKAKDPNWDQDF